jgi:hypothetical protein
MSSRAPALMQTAKPPQVSILAGSILQRQCACGQHSASGECEERKNQHKTLQRHSNGGSGPLTAPPIVNEVLRSSGQPLDGDSRAFFESRFNHDFSQIRVHADPRAANSAWAVSALAYTVGNHIVFGTDQYAPQTDAGQHLLAHELTHTLQQRQGSLSSPTVVDSDQHEREAESTAAGISSRQPTALGSSASAGSLFRQKGDVDGPPAIDRTFELQPHVVPMDAHAEREKEKCEEFPGGSTDCEVDEKTGTPTGKVSHHVDETNACTKPCVEEHEGVHVKQLKKFCPELRDCYLAADKGKRAVTDCFKMAMFTAKRECEAYQVSVPCVEKRLKSAPECQTKENKSYGARKLTSEKCFKEKNCAGAGTK